LKTQFDVLICDLDVQDFTGKEILPAKHAKYAKNKTQKSTILLACLACFAGNKIIFQIVS